MSDVSPAPVSFADAERQGRAANASYDHDLTITAQDLEQLVHVRGYVADLAGTVTWPSLSSAPVRVSDGKFALFVDDPDHVGQVHMRYTMVLRTPHRDHLFVGIKTLHTTSTDIVRVWSQTTTLYVTVYDGVSETDPVKSRGIIRISLIWFLRLLGTLHATNASSAEERRQGALRFGALFVGELYRIYGGLGVEPRFDERIGTGATPGQSAPLRGTEYDFWTDDRVKLKLTRYRGGTKGPVILSPGFGVSSEIFSLDTIKTNLTRYLFDNGYDVWLLDYRTSIALPSGRTEYDGDAVARYDYPRAVEVVRSQTRAQSVQCVVHCFGSTTFFMSVLSGRLTGVRSAVSSQIAINVLAPWRTRLNAALHIPDVLARLSVKYVTVRATRGEALYLRAFDWVLGLTTYPFGPEHCDSANCHRISFLYGRLYQHAQLNTSTHEDGLRASFGVANVRGFEHICEMVRRRRAVTLDGHDVYVANNVARLRIPITFIHGARNRCYLPKSTKMTFDLLLKENGQGLYDRHVIPGYGHIDCIMGQNAVTDVYPFILTALDAHP
jgi:cholesterol oxidase